MENGVMKVLLVLVVVLLSFANGANDNCKRVATLWAASAFDESKPLAIAEVPPMVSSLAVPAPMRGAPAAECDRGE